VAESSCVAGTIVKYQYTSNPKDHNLTICTLKTNASDPNVPTELEGDTVAIYGRAAGGSLLGLKPILVPQPIRFINPATCDTADAIDSTVQNCTGLSGTDYTSGQTPDLGLTDEDAQYLGNVAAEVDTSQADPLTLAERNVLNGTTSSGFQSVGSYQLVWSVQAGVNFPLNNISWEAWRGVMAGTLTSVGDVMRAMGQVPTTAQKAQGLRVCLRTNTSGTMSGQVGLALGSQYCGSPGPLPALNEAADDGAGSSGIPADYNVILATSSGNLESCLSGTANTNSGSPSGSIPADATALQRAIGINSLENAGASANIKELQIDGVAPTLQNAAQGIYKYYHESALNYNTDFLDGPTISGRSTAAERNAFLSLYQAKVTAPGPIASSGLNGILATPFNGTPDLVWNPSNPVGWTSKLVGFGGSNCNEPLQVFPATDTE
jgi:hypothetical protein